MYRKQLITVINNIVEEHNIQVKPEIIDDYKKLNEKCDTLILKIKTRKSKREK